DCHCEPGWRRRESEREFVSADVIGRTDRPHNAQYVRCDIGKSYPMVLCRTRRLKTKIRSSSGKKRICIEGVKIAIALRLPVSIIVVVRTPLKICCRSADSVIQVIVDYVARTIIDRVRTDVHHVATADLSRDNYIVSDDGVLRPVPNLDRPFAIRV